MKYRRLGRTDLRVSEIGFGLWTVSTNWWGEYSREEAMRLLRLAWEQGITFYDTADTYGQGYGEELLSRTFSVSERKSLVIATKFGYDFYHHGQERQGHNEIPQVWEADYVRFALEQSLRRLGRDYVDLYQLHNPRLEAVGNDDLFKTLETLQKEGKVRAVGVALGPAIGWKEEGIKSMTARQVHSLQTVYNLMEPSPGCDFFPVARERGVGILVRVPHASGLLEGHWDEKTTFSPNDHRYHRVKGNPEWLREGVKKVEKLRFLTDSGERTMAQAALQFILAEPSVSSILPNIYEADQLTEFARTCETPALTSEEMDRVQTLVKNNFSQPLVSV